MKTYEKLSQLLLSLSIMLFNGIAHATSSSIPEDAINCSALFLIMTSLTTENPEAGLKATNSGMRMDFIYAAHEKNLTGKRITNGDVSRLKDTRMKALSKQYDADPNSVVREYLFCSQWDKSVTSYIEANSEKADVLKIPKSPSKQSQNQEQVISAKQSVVAAFQAWSEAKRMTPDDIRNMLRKMAEGKE